MLPDAGGGEHTRSQGKHEIMTTAAALGREVCGDTFDPEGVECHGKVVVYRADLNVPVVHGRITDSSRIDGTLATLRLLLSKGARVAVISHFGRPDPDKQTLEEMRKEYSLRAVADALAEKLPSGAFQGFAPDCIGPTAEEAVSQLQPGQVCLLENLRFHSGEAANSEAFARQLAALGDIYVNDAFGVIHRDQASITAITLYMNECYPGLLLRQELQYLAGVVSAPARPFGVIIGGAKVADKLGVIKSLIQTADVLLIGGRMAFTFLAAQRVQVGRTQIEKDWLEPALEMLSAAQARGVELLLPCDVVVARNWDDGQGCCTVPLTPHCCSKERPCVPEGCYGLDIGPQTCEDFAAAIAKCKTVFWNGPMGRFEVPGFAGGTEAVARALGEATQQGCTTILGGGDSVSAVKQLVPPPPFSYISTGGGASLELLEGKVLPGLRALAEAGRRGSKPVPHTA